MLIITDLAADLQETKSYKGKGPDAYCIRAFPLVYWRDCY